MILLRFYYAGLNNLADVSATAAAMRKQRVAELAATKAERAKVSA